EPVFLRRRRRNLRGRDVLNRVAVGDDETAHALGPQSGDDTGGAPAPVKTDEHRPRQIERIHKIQEILAERTLLARTWSGRRQEPRRAVAAQIRDDRAMAGGHEFWNHFVVTA